MIIKGLTALILLFAFSTFSVAASASEPDDNTSETHTAFSLQEWFSRADAKWRISYFYRIQYNTLSALGITPGTTGKIESELTFKKIDSPISILTAGTKLIQYLSFDVLYGTGSISKGRGTDTDRFLPDAGGGVEFSKSTSDLNGDVKQWGLNFYYNNKRFSDNHQSPWGLVLGYLHYEDNLQMTNAAQVTSVPFENITFPAEGPFPPNLVLNSTYDFSWDALKVGVMHQSELTKRLSSIATVAIYPLIYYRGEGYWNLRAGTGPNDFRIQSPNFIQTSSTGYGYEASLGLLYMFSKNVGLSGGYRYFYLYADNGTDTKYFADGAESKTNLDWVTITRQGAYAELLFKF